MKIERPIPIALEMELKDASESGDVFIGLLGSLYQGGFAFRGPDELRRGSKNSAQLELICTLVDSKAWNLWKKSTQYKEHWRPRFKKHLKGPPKIVRRIDIVNEYDSVKTCSCIEWPSFILSVNWFEHTGAVVCGECLNSIPQYLFPPEIGAEDWKEVYKQVYRIWLASGTLEKWAEKQLGDYNSDLNKEARKVIGRLKKFRKVPAYYPIWTEDFSLDMPCPNCGRAGKESPWTKPARVCGVCKLAFGF